MPQAEPRLRLLSRPGCHLCERMRSDLEGIAAAAVLGLEEVDIDTDPDLAKRWSNDIPILLLDGQEIARHRLTPEARTAISASA